MVNRLDKQLEIKSFQKQNLASIIRRLYERFIMIRGEPREVALGFALGIFVGMTPTVGIQTPIAIFFAALFKWSKLSAAIGVWISNPLTVPIIYRYFIGPIYFTWFDFFSKVRPIFSLCFAQNLETDLVKQLICCDCAKAAQLMCNK